MQAVAERQVCESPGVTRVLFSGYSSQLAECLERLGSSDGPIDELRITSRGGEAWATLPRRRACWILVTPEMAARCLKGTKIDSFAAPEAQDAFEVRLGFFRALK